MYRKQIEEYIDNHSQEMIEDIFTLCRINSGKALWPRSRPRPGSCHEDGGRIRICGPQL